MTGKIKVTTQPKPDGLPGVTLERLGSTCLADKETGKSLLHAIITRHDGDSDKTHAIHRKDVMERLVACWNALRGIPTATIKFHNDLDSISGTVETWGDPEQIIAERGERAQQVIEKMESNDVPTEP